MTYTTAHDHAESLTHSVRPGIEPPSSWILVRFTTTEPQWEPRPRPSFKENVLPERLRMMLIPSFSGWKAVLGILVPCAQSDATAPLLSAQLLCPLRTRASQNSGFCSHTAHAASPGEACQAEPATHWQQPALTVNQGAQPRPGFGLKKTCSAEEMPSSVSWS